MALARLKTWVAAEVLYASDLNAEFNNILNNAHTMLSPLTGHLDVDNFDLLDLSELEFRDASASPSNLRRMRLNGTTLQWRAGDARTNTTARALALEALTTGTPAASIGVGLILRGESADEAPSDFGALDFIATDVTAGSEDTVLDILVRVAGAALTAVYRLHATGAFRATLTHANTAERTYTLPDRAAAFEDKNMQVLMTQVFS